MVSELTVGAGLAILAWLGLQVTVFHGKYVIDKIAAGEYSKGPFSHARDSATIGNVEAHGGTGAHIVGEENALAHSPLPTVIRSVRYCYFCFYSARLNTL